MAAGAEVTQPVSAAFHKRSLNLHCHRLETGVNLAENSEECLEPNKIAKDTARSPRPLSFRHVHCSTTLASPGDAREDDISLRHSISDGFAEVQFKPVIRSGGCSNIGRRRSMEDEHIRIDDFSKHFGRLFVGEAPEAFYGVFDGHNGGDAARFVKEKLLQFILDDVAFPTEMEAAIRHGFQQTDHAFSEACDTYDIASGTTAITAFISGRNLLVANAGDCRAVLCRGGRAVELSRDHKPSCAYERTRIKALGGSVEDGYLNGQLGVARALGDWDMKGLKGTECPLTAEPEVQQTTLSEADEFIVIGCDGLWDVVSSQMAVDFTRKQLQQHNDPDLCSRELVDKALCLGTLDNLTVVVVCFRAEPPPMLMPFRIQKFSVRGLKTVQDLIRCSF